MTTKIEAVPPTLKQALAARATELLGGRSADPTLLSGIAERLNRECAVGPSGRDATPAFQRAVGANYLTGARVAALLGVSVKMSSRFEGLK